MSFRVARRCAGHWRMANAHYSDDVTILSPAELWRRIPPKHLVQDENLGRLRPSTAAFEDHPNGSPMSVALADVVIGTGRTPLGLLAGLEAYALASITAGLARECGQGVSREPLPNEPAHAVVFGRKTDRTRKRFSLECHWVVPPPE